MCWHVSRDNAQTLCFVRVSDELQQHGERHHPDTATLAARQVVDVVEEDDWQMLVVHPHLRMKEGGSRFPLGSLPRFACRTSPSGRPSLPEPGYALAASGKASANTPRSPVTSSSATCHAGATLFLVTCTRIRLPITWPPSRRQPSGRRSRRTEA